MLIYRYVNRRHTQRQSLGGGTEAASYSTCYYYYEARCAITLAEVALDFFQLSLDGVAIVLDGLTVVDQLSEYADRGRPLQVRCRTSRRQRPLDVRLSTHTQSSPTQPPILSGTGNLVNQPFQYIHHHRRRVAGEGRRVVAAPCPALSDSFEFIGAI